MTNEHFERARRLFLKNDPTSYKALATLSDSELSQLHHYGEMIVATMENLPTEEQQGESIQDILKMGNLIVALVEIVIYDRKQGIQLAPGDQDEEG